VIAHHNRVTTVDMDEPTTLQFIADNPRSAVPVNASRAVDRLLRFQLIRPASAGYMLRSGGVEVLVRNGATPQWVRDEIERGRTSGGQL
jgi:hypothetical protein